MGALLSAEDLQLLQRIETRAVQLDAAWRIPVLGVYVGWDPLISFVPLVGDILMAGVGLRLVSDATRLGIDRPVVMRMWVNVAIDLLLGMIPLVGPILDVFFRSNMLNLKLLLDDLDRRRAARPII